MSKLSIEELKELRICAALMKNNGVVAALDELIELKGDQVPFGYVEHQAAVKVVKGETRFAALTMEPKGDKCLPLFTTPQNPVSLPPDGIAKALHDCDWAGVSIGNKAIISAAIHALRAQPQKPVVLPERMAPEDVRWHLKQSDHDDGEPGRIEHAEAIGAKMWNDCLDTIHYQIANPGKADTGPTKALRNLMARKRLK